MANYAITNPYPVILNQIGTGLNGGKVYIGEPNKDPETFPVAVYWDEGGTDPAAQPLRTVGGYISRAGSPAEVFGPTPYSIRVRDRFNQQIFYAPDVGGALADFITSLSAEDGASLIGFKQPTVSAVVRNLLDRGRDTIHAKDFGAKFDGITNDTATIQAALDYAASIGGGIVELQVGAAITQTLNRPENVMIMGQHRRGTRLVAPAGYNAPLIQSIGSLAGAVNRGGVQNLALIGSGKIPGMVGIREVFTNRSTHRDIDIFSMYEGMYVENVWQVAWDNLHVHGGGTDQSRTGFRFGPKDPTVGVSNAVVANNCMAQGVEYCGWRLENSNGSKFVNCEGTDGVHGWYLGDPSSGSEDFLFCNFANCLADTNSSHNWRIEKGAASSIRYPQFVGCWGGTSTGGSNLYVAGASGLLFSGWQMAAANRHGVHFNESSRCVLGSSQIRDWNTGSGAYNGVYVQNSSAIKVSNSEIYTNTLGTGKGFVEAGTSDYNILNGSNVSNGVALIGTHSLNVDNTAF